MKLRWFLSAHDSVDKIILNSTSDKALEMNNMEPITIEENSIEESFKKFINSKAFNDFADNSLSKTLYWYYYDEKGTLQPYPASTESEIDL